MISLYNNTLNFMYSSSSIKMFYLLKVWSQTQVNISANESLLKSGKKNTNHYQTNIFDWGYTFEQQHTDKVLFLNS